MVRETRYLWVGNIPEKISEDDLTQHFQRYGKIQSVKIVVEDGTRAAVVAFMDIKSASKAHGAENKIDGKLVETQYSEASGRGSKVTRTSFEAEPSTRVNPPPGNRYETTKPGYDGYGYGSYYGSSGPGRGEEPVAGERWQATEASGDYYQQERGRPRQRYPPQTPEYYTKQKSYEGHYPGAYDKYGGPIGPPTRPPRAGQSPGKPDAVGKVKLPPKSYQQSHSRSRSRSSSSSSSGSHSTSTSRSRRSSSKASKERKRGSVVVQPHKKPHPTEESKGGLSGGKLGLMLRGFPPRSSDTSIRDGLFHEYKKCGKVMSVSITGEKEDRYAIVTFKKIEDAAKGLEQARARVFFGRKVEAEPHDGIDDSMADYRPPEAELDEYHHKATRTLFVGNLQTDTGKDVLKDIFRRYGLILDIDIKNQQPNQVFAFVQYDNIKSVVAALHEMDGENVGNSKVKLGFGRSMPTNVLWVDNITEQVQESYLKRQFCRAAPVNYVLIDRDTGRALVFYDNNELAVMSLSAMRGRAIASKKIQIDFASSACMNALMDNMEATAQLRPEDRPDQKGFRQYPPPAHAPDTPYEERQGYDRTGKPYYYEKSYRGRGTFRGGPGYSRGRAYFQGGYDENYKKRYDETYDEDPTKYALNEDYERELHDYKAYKTKEGVEGGSSPYTRTSDRYADYTGKEDFFDGRSSDRYKDTDSQSGDRESMRSHQSDSKVRDKYEKYIDEKLSKDKNIDEKRKDKLRGYSPGSEYRMQRSPSNSPPRSRKTSKDTRMKSPSSPSRFSSPEISSPKKVLKSKIDSTVTPSTTLISEIQKTRPRKHPLKRESETDLSELDRALLKTDLFESPPKKRQAIEEQIERSRKEAEANLEYRQKLEREHALRRSSSGSHSMDYSGTVVDNFSNVRAKGDNFPVHLDNRIPPTYGEGEYESKFSTPSPSTKSTKSESDKTPDSSERHSSGQSSGEMDILEKEKLRLLSELKDMEDNSSVSDGEIRDEEEEMKSKEKKPRLEEVFDLEWSPSESSMKKWREKAKKLEREKQVLEGQENKEPHPKNAHTEPPPKPPEPPGTGDAKFKPIDTKKSFRKQMEAMRKEHDKDTIITNSRDSKNGEGPRESHKKTTQGPEMDIEENSMDTNTKNKSSEFKKKKGSNSNDFPKVKGQRSYRTTRSDEMSFGLSSGDEHEGKKEKAEESVHRDTAKSRRTSDTRHESTDSKKSGSQDIERDSSTRSRHGSKDSRESSNSRTRKDSQSRDSRRDRSGDNSIKKSVRDLRTEPCIIPDFTIETKDSKHGKIIPTDPRKQKDKQSPPVSLPLPKFASKFFKKNSPKQASKSRSSPKGQQDSSLSFQKSSPLFSPDISPTVSKSKGDRLSRKDSFEKSQEKSIDNVSQNEDSKSVDKEETNIIKTETKDDTDIFNDIQTAILDNIKLEKSDNNSEIEKDNIVVGSKQSIESNESNSSFLVESSIKTENKDTNKLHSDKVNNETVSDITEKLDTNEHQPMDTNEIIITSAKIVPKTVKVELNTINSATVSAESQSVDNIETGIILKIEPEEDEKCKKELDKELIENQVENKVSESSEKQLDKSIVKCSSKELSNLPVTPVKEATTSPNKEKHTSDSDLSDLDNSALQSLDERIRALDEKLEQASSSVDVRRTPTDSPSGPSTPTVSTAPYRERFRVRKRDSNASIASSTTTSDNKGEPSDYVKSLLSRSSIFDQDSKRLEQIDEKYQPKEYNLNLDRPTGSVGGSSDFEDEDFESRVKEYYGLSQPKAPTFPSAILRNQLSAGLDTENAENANDAFGLGPSLTFAPPGSQANQDMSNKYGPQALSRYPFLATKKPSFDFSKSSPPQSTTPITVTPEALRSPTMLPRDPRRDPLSPPVVMPPSILKKSPVTTPVHTSPGVSSVSPLSNLSSPPAGILRKSEPGPSILKRSESLSRKNESSESLLVGDDSSKVSDLNIMSVNCNKTEEYIQNSSKREILPKIETKETDKSNIKGNCSSLDDTHTPSGTGNTAVSSQHIEPENSAVPKNELSSGDGVQYQSTPSPPVLVNENKATQGIGTKTSLNNKRTASEAFEEERSDKDLNDNASPPQLTTESLMESYYKEERNDIDSSKNTSSPKVSEPEPKKAKTVPEIKKEKKSVAVNKEGKKSSSLKSSSKSEKKAENHKKSVDSDKKLSEKKSAHKQNPIGKSTSHSDKKSFEKANSSDSDKSSVTSNDSKKLKTSGDKTVGSTKKYSSSSASSSKSNSSSDRLATKTHEKTGSEKKSVEKGKHAESNSADKKQSEKTINNMEKMTEKKSNEKSPPGSEKYSVDKKVSEKKSPLQSEKKVINHDKKSDKYTDKKVSDVKHGGTTEKKNDKSDSEKKNNSICSSDKKTFDKTSSDKNKKSVESKNKETSKQSEKSRHHSSTSSVSSTKSCGSSGSKSDSKKEYSSKKDTNMNSSKPVKEGKKELVKSTKDSTKVQKSEESSHKPDKKQSPNTESKYKSKSSEDSTKSSSKSTSDSKKPGSSKEKESNANESKTKFDSHCEKLPSQETLVKLEEKKVEIIKSEKQTSKEGSKSDKSSKLDQKDVKFEKNDKLEKTESKNRIEKSDKSDKTSKSDRNSSVKSESSNKDSSKSKDKSSKEKNKENTSKINDDRLNKSEKHKQSHSDSKTKQKSNSERSQHKKDESKIKSTSDKRDHKNNRKNDKICDKKQKSPADRKQRSDSMTGETRELKQLRESLGIDADGMLNGEPVQFFSMYDMVKRRTHKEVTKEDKAEERRNQLKNSRRKSFKMSDDSEGSSSSDDSAFSSENKENKKNLSKTKVANRKYIMSSSSDDFSSDESDIQVSKKKNKPQNSAVKKTASSKKKTFVSSSSDQTSDSTSSDSSDDEKRASKKTLSVTPPKLSPKKKIQKSVESNSSSSGSDSDVKTKLPSKSAANKKQPSPRQSTNNNKTKTSTELKKKTPVKKIMKKKLQTSSSSSDSSSEDSDSESSDQEVKASKSKKKTALEKLESIFDASNSNDSSSSDDIVSPAKVEKKPSPVLKKKTAGLFSDSDEQNAINKTKSAQIKSGKVSKAKKFVPSTSESSDSSSQSDSSDSEPVTKKSSQKSKSPSKIVRRQSNEGCQKGLSHKEAAVDGKDRKKLSSKGNEKKMQEQITEKRSKNNSPVRRQSVKEPSTPIINKVKSTKAKEVQIKKSTKSEKSAEKITKDGDGSNKIKNKELGEVNTEPKVNEKPKEEKVPVTKKPNETELDSNSSGSDSSSAEEENKLNITEEEKGMEEKANKLQSIFKHNDNIFEKMELSSEISPETPGSDDRDQSSQCSGDEVEKEVFTKSSTPLVEENKDKKQKSIENKLFDSSDSESEVDVKLQTEKILQQQEDSQDSELNIPSTPDFDDSQDGEKENEIDNVLKGVQDTPSKVETASKLEESLHDQEKSVKKPESPKSEPVKNTVVETEKAVRSLEKLWEEPLAPTIVETGIVANVEIQSSENVEEEQKTVEAKEVTMVAEDEVANAILSICGIGENDSVSVISDPELAASIAAEAGQGDVESNVIYQIEEGSTEAQQAVAALVFGNEENSDIVVEQKENEETFAIAIENEVPVTVQDDVTAPSIPLEHVEDQDVMTKELQQNKVSEETQEIRNNEFSNSLDINTSNLSANTKSSVIAETFQPHSSPEKTDTCLTKTDRESMPHVKPKQNNDVKSSTELSSRKSSLEVDLSLEPNTNVPNKNLQSTESFEIKASLTSEQNLKEKDDSIEPIVIQPMTDSSRDVDKNNFDVDSFAVKHVENKKSNENNFDTLLKTTDINKGNNKSAVEPIIIKPVTVEGNKGPNSNIKESIQSDVTIQKPVSETQTLGKLDTPAQKLVDHSIMSEPKEVQPSKYISELLANPNRIQEIIDADKPKPVKQRSIEPVQIPSFERLSSLPSKADPLMLPNPLSLPNNPPYYAERKDDFPRFIPPSFSLVPKDNVQKQKVPAPTSITKPVEHKIESMVNPQNLEQPPSYRHVMPQQPFDHHIIKPLTSPKVTCAKPQNLFDMKKSQSIGLSSVDSMSNVNKPPGLSVFNHKNQHSPKNYAQHPSDQSLQKIASPKNNLYDLDNLIQKVLKDQQQQQKEESKVKPDDSITLNDHTSSKKEKLPEKSIIEGKEEVSEKLLEFSENKEKGELKTYENRSSSYDMFNSPEQEELGTSVHESDTDREKDEEEQKDNIVYEKEPEKEAIPIEDLNDFEDEEDLPDLIIDESSPIGSKNTQEDEENEENLSCDKQISEKTLDSGAHNIDKDLTMKVASIDNTEKMKQKENIPEVPKQPQEIEVSLKEGEELEGGVLHIVETDNQPQPMITLTPSKVAPTAPTTPKSRRKAKGAKRQKKTVVSPVLGTPAIKALQNTPQENFVPPVVAPVNVKVSPQNNVDLVRSPVTRRKAKQDDTAIPQTTVSPPNTRNRAGNGENGEKFSSRGRKIIPKERGDEVSTLTRKGRRNASAGANNTDETKLVVKKGEEPFDKNHDGSETSGKKKTWPLRNRKESDVSVQENKEEVSNDSIISDVPAVEPPSAGPPKEGGPIKITLRRTPRGRKATIQKTTTGEAAPNSELVYTNVTESDQSTAKPVALPAVQEQTAASVPAPTEDNVRTRRSRRATKGRKSSDATSPATRTRKNDGSSSPRSKSSEATSPKELAKSFVRLEKLNIEQSAVKKDEDDQKDLYEWNDEEDKPLPESYKVARAARKRKSNEVISNAETPQKVEPDVVEPIKRTKKSKAAAELKKEKELREKEAKQAAEQKVIPPVKVVVPPPQPEKKETVLEKKEVPPEPRKPDMNDILQGQRGHLPLKLAMKWESQEAARKEREAKEAAEKAATEKAAHEAQKIAEQQKNATEHLDKVIDEVARGHFEKSEEARIIDKKRGRFNREDQFSPGVQDLSRTAVSSGAPNVSAAVSVLSPHITSQGVAHRQTLPARSTPNAVQTGVVSTGAYGLATSDGSQGQSIVRVPNPHMDVYGQQKGQTSRPDVIHSVSNTFSSLSNEAIVSKSTSQQPSGIMSVAKSDNPSHMPVTVAVPPMMAGQTTLASPQQLSPHSVRGPSPRVQIPGYPSQHYQHPGMPPPSQISPTQQSQGSELRQVLSQPSKLVQQEQLLQQQRLQDRHGQQLSPHLADPKQGSPTIPGQHRMQFPLQDRTSTRADPKGTAGQGPLSATHLSGRDGSRPETTGVFPGPPELALAHPDLHKGLPPGQMLIPGMPVPPHMVPYLPRMPVDPRVLQQIHEQQIAQQMLGILPPHHPQAAAMVSQHQPQVADRHPHDQASGGGRPPSRHPTPPTAQPSPRGTPHHHSPQVSTPLTPQLPQPPIAALPGLPGRQPPLAHMSNGIQPGLPPDGMIVAVQQYPIVWQGYLYLKNDASNVQMHFVTGNRALVSGALDGATEGGIVRIAQRMRLEPTQLDGVSKRMQKDDEFSMLVAVPHGKDQLDFMHQTSKLQAGFIQYLQQKQAAGIVNIPNPIQPGYVVHIFPPCDFSSRNINMKAPELSRCLGDQSYLVVVITST